MCGICGLIDWKRDRPMDPAVVRRMAWMIRHRGPDELGYYDDGQAALGHARLSIIDLSGGAQPMSNEDDSLWITFNGEIFNYIELRPDLEARGHRFKTRCDTEVILHLYEEYGPDCVQRMNGQFAFCIWDRKRRTAFLARDRVGIRPLYYTIADHRFLFGSEIKCLLAAPGVTAALDPLGIDQAFTFWSPLPPRTAFEGISLLPPAHYAIVTEEGVRLKRYWLHAFPAESETETASEQEYVEGLREELVKATRLRMRADVPIGAYLSGGLDSSLTSGIVTQFTDATLNTFSVRFEDAQYDEGEHQDTMIARLGTAHHSIRVGRKQIAEAFPEVMRHAEAPMLRTAPVPLHLLSKLVREVGIKVVVTGEGADEMLGGYNIFREDKIRRFWAREPQSALRPLLLSRLYPYIQRSGPNAAYWKQFFAVGLTETSNPCYSHHIRWHNTIALKRFFSKALRERIGDYDAVAEFRGTLPEGFDSWAPLSRAQHIEVATFMSTYLLSSQGDRVSASHGIEGRFPFLDVNVIEYASRIPPKFKIRALEEKRILRLAAADIIPDTIRRRGKQPYRAPDSVSFFNNPGADYVRDLLDERAVAEAGCFEPQMVNRLVAKCAEAKAPPSARDDMALVGILATQLLYEQLVRDLPIEEPDESQFRVRKAEAQAT